MDIALVVSLVALLVAFVALAIVSLSTYIIYRNFVRTTLVNRDLERPSTQITPGLHPGEQATTARTPDAAKRVSPAAFLDVPALSPEAIAPSLGRPPMPKGGFGTKVATWRDE